MFLSLLLPTLRYVALAPPCCAYVGCVAAQVALTEVKDSALASELFTKLSLETPDERAILRKGEGWSYEQWNEYVCTLFRLWYSRWRYLRHIIAVSAGARDPPVVARPVKQRDQGEIQREPASDDSGSDSGGEDGAAAASHVELDLPEPTAEQVAEELEWSILLAAFGKRNPLGRGACVGDLSVRARALLLHTLVQWHLDDVHDELAAGIATAPAAELRATSIHSPDTATDYMLLHQLPGPVRLYACRLTRDAAAAAHHAGAALSPARAAAAPLATGSTQGHRSDDSQDESDSGSDSADDEFDVGNAAWGRKPVRPAQGGFSLAATGDADILQFIRSMSGKTKGVAAAIQRALSGDGDSDDDSTETDTPPQDMQRQAQHVYVSVFQQEHAEHEAAEEAERSRRVSARLAAQVAQEQAERAAQWEARVQARRSALSEHFDKHHRSRQRLLLEAQDAAVWGPMRRRLFPGHGPPAPSSLLPNGDKGPSAWSVKAANAAAAEAEAVARREAAEDARREETARLAAKRGSRSRRRDVMRLTSQLLASANYECGVWRDIWSAQSPAALAASASHAASAMAQEVGVLEDEREAPLRAASAALSRQLALQRHSSVMQEWPRMAEQWGALEDHFLHALAWEASAARLQRRLRTTRDKFKGAAPTAVLNKWVDSSLGACRAALAAQGTPCPSSADAPPAASGVVGIALLPAFVPAALAPDGKEPVQDIANKQLFAAVAEAADAAAGAVVESWLDPTAEQEQCALFSAMGVQHVLAEQQADDALASRARRLGKAALLLAQSGAKPSAVLQERGQLQDVAEHLQELMRPVRVRIKGGQQYRAPGRGVTLSTAAAAMGDAAAPKAALHPELAQAVDKVVDSACMFLQSNLAHIKARMVPASPWPRPSMPLVQAGANAAAAVHAARLQAAQLAHMQAMAAQAQASAVAQAPASGSARQHATSASGQVHFMQTEGAVPAPPSYMGAGGDSVAAPMYSGSASVIALPEEAAVSEARAPPGSSGSMAGTAVSADGTQSEGAEDLTGENKAPEALLGRASHVSVAGAVAGDGSVLSGGRQAPGRDSFGETRSGFGNTAPRGTSPGVVHAPTSSSDSSRSGSHGRGTQTHSTVTTPSASRAAGDSARGVPAPPSHSDGDKHASAGVLGASIAPTMDGKSATLASAAYQASVQSAHVSESSDDERASERVPAAHASAGVSVDGSAASQQDEADSFAGGQSPRSEDGAARRRRHLPAVTGMAPSALGLPSKAPAVDEPQQANALDVAQPSQDMSLPAPNVAPPRPAAPFAPGARHGGSPPGTAAPTPQLMAAAADGDSVVAQGEPALSVGQPRWAEPRVAAAGRAAMPRGAAESDGIRSTSKGSPGRVVEPPLSGGLPAAASTRQGRGARSSQAFPHNTFLPEGSEPSARGGGMSSFSLSQAPAAQYTMSRGGLSAGGASVGTAGRPPSSSAGSTSDRGSV